LLIDEILAVGDSDFQRKCIDKIISLKKKGTTIIFISHNLENIKTICDKVIKINLGVVSAFERVDEFKEKNI
jgi:ABC-type polysaccharide/polyol phosphate transport system ATPase subunit